MERYKEPVQMENTCVAYGCFDSIHKGHLAIAKKLVEIAKEKKINSVIVSIPKDGDVFTTEEEKEYALKILRSFGKVEIVAENMIDAVVAVSGSAPAYVFMFIEAMADAGVREGLTRTAALELAAQTVLGSAKMVMETGKHPAELRDMVCSPGGTTIDAVCVLEEKGLRSALEAAVRACAEKADKMAGR